MIIIESIDLMEVWCAEDIVIESVLSMVEFVVLRAWALMLMDGSSEESSLLVRDAWLVLRDTPMVDFPTFMLVRSVPTGSTFYSRMLISAQEFDM